MDPEELRKRYGLGPVPPLDPKQQWNWDELARVFVQRFQQIFGIREDGLAGPNSFAVLDGLERKTWKP